MEVQDSLGLFHVCERVTDIPFSCRLVDGLEADAQYPVKCADELIQTGLYAAPDVEDFAGARGVRCGPPVGLYHIGHVSEIPRLLAVAVDRRLLSGEHAGDKARYDG